SELVLYPNPTDADLHLTFSSLYAGAAKLKVTDLTGKVVQAYPLYLQEGKNMIITQTNQLASGSYLLQLEFNGAVTTLPFVVE
ncbi:MAG: Secretion system C-terminal sorting domain, partial [Bacteroidota bacterium]